MYTRMHLTVQITAAGKLSRSVRISDTLRSNKYILYRDTLDASIIGSIDPPGFTSRGELFDFEHRDRERRMREITSEADLFHFRTVLCVTLE